MNVGVDDTAEAARAEWPGVVVPGVVVPGVIARAVTVIVAVTCRTVPSIPRPETTIEWPPVVVPEGIVTVAE